MEEESGEAQKENNKKVIYIKRQNKSSISIKGIKEKGKKCKVKHMVDGRKCK